MERWDRGLELESIPAKVINYRRFETKYSGMSRGNSLSDEVELRSVLVDTRSYLYGPDLG